MVHVDSWVSARHLLQNNNKVFWQEFLQATDLIMEFFLEGWSKVCGHLSDSVAGSIADPRVLDRTNLLFTKCTFCSKLSRRSLLQQMKETGLI